MVNTVKFGFALNSRNWKPCFKLFFYAQALCALLVCLSKYFFLCYSCCMKQVLKIFQKACDILELFLALLVAVALGISIIRFIPHLAELWHASGNAEIFLEFLENIFNFVVGIEFIKLLCKPNTENTFEVLIFLVARHMILGKNSALDMFFSIIGIATLCVVRHFLQQHKLKNAGHTNSEQLQ